MKRILTTTALLLAFLMTHAQEKSPKFTRIYGFGSVGVSIVGVSAELGGRAVLKDKWCFSAGQLSGAINAKTPSDYTPGVLDVLFLTPLTMQNESKFTYLAAGRYFGKGTSVGGFVEVGAGISGGYYWSFEKGGVLGGNYNTKKIDDNAFGAMIRGGVDCPLTSWLGLGFDLFYNFNGGQLSDNLGLEMRLMLGKTGKRKR